MTKIITIATRVSDLALRQTDIAIQELKIYFGDNVRFEILKIKTTGDLILDKNLYEIGGKSLFTKEIEEALLKGDADIAVHSMKDVTAEFAQGLVFKSYLKREDPRDALVSKYKSLDDIPIGAKIGTSSSRRRLFVNQLRPDLELVTIRGNVPTRIRALENGKVNAIILAVAGLKRLAIDEQLYTPLSTEQFIPAICQGVIGLQSRVDFNFNDLIAKTSNKEAEITSNCERAFLKYFNADCKTPIAGFARIQANQLFFTGMYQNANKLPIIETAIGDILNPEDLAISVATKISSCIY